MNKTIRFASFILALLTILFVVCACHTIDDPDKDKFVVATYDGGKVYSDDITQWVNFLYVKQYEQVKNGALTKDAIAKQAIESILLNKFLDEELKKLDLAISDDDLEMLVSNQILELNQSFDETDSSTGENYKGYEGWKKAFNVDDKFIYEVVKFIQQEQLMAYYLADKKSITDEELYEYYVNHAVNYSKEAGFYFNFALVEVKDMQNDTEVEEAKAKTQDYIDKLINKTITFDEIVTEVKETYTTDNGYSGMAVAISAEDDFLNLEEFEKRNKVTDLEEYIAVTTEYYKDGMDKNADVNSEAYKNYLKYRLELYLGKTTYVMLKKEPCIYPEPIEYPNGFVVFEFKGYQKSSWGNFDDVKEQVREDFVEANLNKDLTAYEAELLDNHKVAIEDFKVE